MDNKHLIFKDLWSIIFSFQVLFDPCTNFFVKIMSNSLVLH